MANDNDQSKNALRIVVQKLTPRLLALVLVIGIIILATVLTIAVLRNNHVVIWGIDLDPSLNKQLKSTRDELKTTRLAMELEHSVESRWGGDVRTYLSNSMVSVEVTKYRARDRREIEELVSTSGTQIHRLDFADELPARIVLMDSPIRENVYDPQATPGATNADDIDLILRGPDFPGALLIREGTGKQWDRHDQIKAMDPDIVIIHASALWDNTNDAKEREKFEVFLETLKETQAHVLCYSRSFDTETYLKGWLKQMREVFPEDRLHTFRIQGSPKHFRIRGDDVNSRVAVYLRKEVKRILEIIRTSPNKSLQPDRASHGR